MQEVELTSKEADGLVHMGDVIQIHSAVSESAIAADLSDRVRPPPFCFLSSIATYSVMQLIV
jgi:hypothetical protein